MKIILASNSPRRKEILNGIGLSFEVLSPECDENIFEKNPEKLVQLLARKKAHAVFDKYNGDKTDVLFIAADTVVYRKGEILGKPENPQDTCRMIKLLSGRTHKVITGISLIYNGKEITDKEVTKVYFDKVSTAEIAKYANTEEPNDKAGAYAIQGTAARWITGIKGDYFNVVGLPVYRLIHAARKLGIDL